MARPCPRRIIAMRLRYRRPCSGRSAGLPRSRSRQAPTARLSSLRSLPAEPIGTPRACRCATAWGSNWKSVSRCWRRPAPMSDLVRVFRPRVVLELVDTRLTGAGHDPMLKLADMQINDGLVIGSTPNDWDGGDFGPVEARLVC